MTAAGWRGWRGWAAAARRDVVALSLAARDPRVPWTAKLVAAAVAAYALSPIDLIPDFIPLIGHLDDLVLVPLGIALAARLVPPEVWAELRAEAAARIAAAPSSWAGAVIVIAVWLIALAAVAWGLASWLD